MSYTFALIDCNNFYVSCERAFNPKLWDKPVIVLSNNDGCAVARSNEVKALGIPMGAPYFKFKEELDKIGTIVYSSNYALYGDMSQRVMKILSKFSSEMEIYSIDEAFINLDHVSISDMEEYAKRIRKIILRATGIPVSIGIAQTKTLAKLANELAKKAGKKDKQSSGVVNLMGKDLNPYLESLEVEDIWGVGRQYSKLLRASGVNNALDFTKLSTDWVKKRMTLVGLKTLNELQNKPSYHLEVSADPKKGIASTRSFGQAVTTLKELKEAVASYVTRASEKLRKEKLAASYLYIFVMTDRFKTDYYYNSFGVLLDNQTNYTPELIETAYKCLEKIYKPGLNYKKAGVFVTGLVPQISVKHSLFEVPEIDKNKRDLVMQTVDKLNSKFGRHTIKTLAQGTSQPWRMKSEQRSPRYTTVWGEILKVI